MGPDTRAPDLQTSDLTFAAMPASTQSAAGSRLTFLRDLPAGPAPQAPRPKSSVGSCSPSSASDASFRTCAAPDYLPWSQEETAELPTHIMTALAFLSFNGCQDWCPLAALFLARYTHGAPQLAANPAYAGALTATALLTATKIIEGHRCTMRRFAPIADLIMQRTGDIDLNPEDPLGRLRTMEAGFLGAIAFAISAPRHTVAWYAQELVLHGQVCAQRVGSLEDPPLRQAIARGFPAAARASQSHEQAI